MRAQATRPFLLVVHLLNMQGRYADYRISSACIERWNMSDPDYGYVGRTLECGAQSVAEQRWSHISVSVVNVYCHEMKELLSPYKIA